MHPNINIKSYVFLFKLFVNTFFYYQHEISCHSEKPDFFGQKNKVFGIFLVNNLERRHFVKHQYIMTQKGLVKSENTGYY